jgi:DNA primase
MLNIYEYITEHGIEVVREDGNELACLCPFHKNTDSPAFYINKDTGLWICFNPSCAKRGSLRDLMIFYGDHRPIVKDHTIEDIEALLLDAQTKEEREDWDDALESIRIRLPDEYEKVEYLLNRGFDIETLSYFEIAFSAKRSRIVIPARDEASKLVGFIGRSVDDDIQPKYLYSKGFPRKSILFNLNRAKKFDYVVVVEGSLDAMKVHQAGFPGVVSTLGAAVTDQHIALLRKYFDEVIIFSDNDEAGFSMRDKLVEGLQGKRVRVVEFPEPGLKDPGDMDSVTIASCINKAEDWLFAHLLRCDGHEYMV